MTSDDGTKSAGPYSIGSGHWPGISKLSEETGELQQVLGKLIATGGDAEHWDGSNLVDRLVEELGDVAAAIEFFVLANGLDADAVDKRRRQKVALFCLWHGEQSAARVIAGGS